MLLEAAIGDAYGAVFESAEKDVVKQYNNLVYPHDVPELISIVRFGNYTDDTQMALALQEFIIEKQEWTSLNLANKFVECFKRDPRRGYAGNFYQFLLGIKDGEEFLDKINPISDRSGAAMRSMPLGFIKDLKELREKSDLQANLTHNTKLGRESSYISALMTHYFVYKIGKPAELMNWLGNKVEFWQGRVPTKGYECVCAAATAISLHNSLLDILKCCVDFSGDVDTVATIALYAASLSDDIEKFPKNHELVLNLENNKFGKDYLIQKDQEMRKLYEKVL